MRLKPSAILAAVLLLCIGVTHSDTVSAQTAAPVYGFEVTAPAFPTGVERQRQPDLWMLDVEFKPMRMRYLDVTDPKTGRTRREQVWYLVYRAYNRPVRGSGTSDNTRPEMDLDTPLTRPLFLPRFELITYDRKGAAVPLQTIEDSVLPGAVRQLMPVENRRDVKIAGVVESIQELPEAADDVDPIYGVALFRNVDQETDYFRVVLKGFTNTYEVRDEANGRRIWRKALVQDFARRGDQFDASQAEFEFDGEPEWIYLPGDLVGEDNVLSGRDL